MRSGSLPLIHHPGIPTPVHTLVYPPRTHSGYTPSPYTPWVYTVPYTPWVYPPPYRLSPLGGYPGGIYLSHSWEATLVGISLSHPWEATLVGI